MSLQELIQKFIGYLRDQKGYSQHTIRNYLTDLRQFSEFLASRKTQKGPLDIEEVDYLIIREYLGSLYGRLARTTIARKLSAVRSFFLFLETRGLRKGNPVADIATPKLKKYIPTYLSVDEVFRLLETPDRDNPLGLRDLAIMEVLYSCGIRVGELESLDISSIDFDERLVRVIGKGNRERIEIGRAHV